MDAKTERAKAALKLINRLRKDAGLGATSRFKRGIPKHQRACAIAMTLQGTGITSVSLRGVHTRRKFICWETLFGPVEAGVVRQFIIDFDKGKYPQYEIPKSVVKVQGQVV